MIEIKHEIKMNKEVFVLKDKIEQVQQYFKDKVFAGDYNIISIDKHVISILIDKLYLFNIWIANGRDYCEFYNDHSNSFMFIPQFRQSEKRRLFKKLKPLIDKNHKDVIIKEKKILFDKLKKELEGEI